jgi:Cytochrome c
MGLHGIGVHYLKFVAEATKRGLTVSACRTLRQNTSANSTNTVSKMSLSKKGFNKLWVVVDEWEEPSMKISVSCFLAASLLLGYQELALAQERDLGKLEFSSSCGTCHGVDGKGNGMLASVLKVSPPDLTQLSKKTAASFLWGLYTSKLMEGSR